EPGPGRCSEPGPARCSEPGPGRWTAPGPGRPAPGRSAPGPARCSEPELTAPVATWARLLRAPAGRTPARRPRSRQPRSRLASLGERCDARSAAALAAPAPRGKDPDLGA